METVLCSHNSTIVINKTCPCRITTFFIASSAVSFKHPGKNAESALCHCCCCKRSDALWPGRPMINRRLLIIHMTKAALTVAKVRLRLQGCKHGHSMQDGWRVGCHCKAAVSHQVAAAPAKCRRTVAESGCTRALISPAARGARVDQRKRPMPLRGRPRAWRRFGARWGGRENALLVVCLR